MHTPTDPSSGASSAATNAATNAATSGILWVECPRDAWQGLPGVIPPARKRAHLEHLLEAGFDRLDLGSFVSPRAIPQLADTEEVLADLTAPAGADLLCIIGNERGLERALAARGVTSVGYPLSVNDTFQRRNVGRSVAESWPLVERLLAGATAGGLELVVYLSMGFGNPYGEPWSPEVTAAAVGRLRSMGVSRIALADTMGNADAAGIAAVLDTVLATEPGSPKGPGALGLHLHARPGAWEDRLEAALARGVRWFEGALGGIGGCPFAGDELVGNLPTEEVLPFLARNGFGLPVASGRLPALAAEARDLAAGAH